MPKRIATGVLRSFARRASLGAPAPKLATDGDHAGAAIRRRVTVAIEQLTDATGHRIDIGPRIPTTIARPEEIRVFRLTPKVISFLIARTGFGHMDLVML
jgi:hypothetical protein